MRRILFTLGLVCLIAGPLAAGQMVQNLYFEYPQAMKADNYDQIIIPGCLTIANPGEPMLPRKGVSLLLAPGEQAVSVEYNYGERIKLEGFFNIEPAQRQYPLSYTGPTEHTPPNAAIYNSNEKYPARPETNLSTQYYRGHGIAFVDVCPVEYYPESGELYYYPEIEIKINTEISLNAQSSFSNFIRTDQGTNVLLSKMVENPEMTDMLYGRASLDTDDEGNYNYLIITDSNIAEPLGFFLDDKNSKGILTEIMYVSEIYIDYPGVDNPEKIRNCIIDQYQNHGIDYVLLAGDDEIIPHRGFYETAGGYENDLDVAADIYFSNLDGNWNTDNDNRWGEPGEDDLIGEVYVGRMAVDTEGEMSNFINKTMMYQNQPCIAGIENGMMVGEDLGWSVWGRDYKEEIRLGSSSWGYTTAGFPGNIAVSTLYDYEANWSPLGDLMPALNGGMNLVNHLGHADVTYMMKLYNSNITDVNCTNDGVNAGFYILYSQGCYCGSFDNRTAYGGYGPDCISEQWTTLQHGSVAMVTNSRYGWGDVDGTNGSSQYFDRQFFDAIFGENIYRIGEVQMDSKVDNIPYINFEQNRWCFYCSNLFGDPTLDIWTVQPAPVIASHDNVVVIGQEELQVTVHDTDDNPVIGANVGLTFESICVGSGITDSMGVATVDFIGPMDQPGEMTLIITGHNIQAYTDTIQVIPPEGPYVTYENFELDDEIGGNNNGLLDYGETVDLWLTLENVGIETAEGVYAEISTIDNHITLTDNVAQFGDIAAGQIAQAQDCFTMEISPNCPNNYYFTFNIAMHADNDPQVWEYYLMIPAMAPKIVFQSCTIDDSDGNNDGALDPGESAGFLASLTNTGASDLGAFTANLFTNDSYITISDNGALCDGIPVGQTVALNTPITIGVDPACPDPHEAVLTLSADADNGFFASVTVHVMVGGFSDDFEAGENGWVHYVVDSGFSDQWHQSETRNHSSAGTFSWKCGDAASGDYLNLLDAGLESPSIDVGENCVLRYWQWINSEVSSAYPGYAYDGGVVEISTDDGQSWQQISPVDDYPYLIRTGGTPGPFPAETPCFAGTSDWQEIEFDLNSYAEQAVKFRFRFGSDGAVSQEGWYIDDLRITSSTMYPAPVSLYAGLNNEDQAFLAWAAPESGEPSGYNIYRSDQSGQYGSAPINESPVATTYFVDETCNMSHDNYYVVTAVYAGDAESHYSNEALLPQMYTGIEDDEKSLPTEFDLLQNYPNPFNPRTTIRYNLPEQAHVNITIYDILGREVETLVNENRQAGYHQVTWDAAEHATGIYFYRIVAGDFSESYKMTMIK